MEYLKNNNIVIKDLLPIIGDYLCSTKEVWKDKFEDCLYDIKNLNTREIYMSLEHYKYITDSEITEAELGGEEWVCVLITYDDENCRDWEYNISVYSEEVEEEEYYLRNVNTSSGISLILSNYSD
tara:strand:- start:2037 stop:2411 length:375 start_codon:yes stop_codon:yes gene_type:complete